MARYTGPKCKICRREKTKLFLKGNRCFSDKCAIIRRNYHPGQHGKRSRNRLTDYGKHLREKQKVKRIYGVLEKQFRRYFEKAEKQTGITGENLLKLLEIRLDSVLYSAGIVSSRNQARQLISHGYFTVNKNVVTVPSYTTKIGDEISTSKNNLYILEVEAENLPTWLSWNSKTKTLLIKSLPIRDDINQEINEQLIVEFYSR